MAFRWSHLLGGLLVLGAAGALAGGTRYVNKLHRGTASGKRESGNKHKLDQLEELIEEDEQIVRLAKGIASPFRGTKLASVIKVQFSEKTRDEQPLGTYLKELAGKTGAAVRRLRNGWNSLTGLQQRRFKALQQRADRAIKEMDKVVHGVAETYGRKADVPLWGESRGKQKQQHQAERPVAAQKKEQARQQQVHVPKAAAGDWDQMPVSQSLVHDVVKEIERLTDNFGYGSRAYFDKIAKDSDLLAFTIASDGPENTAVNLGKAMSPAFRQTYLPFKKNAARYINRWAREYAKYLRDRRIS